MSDRNTLLTALDDIAATPPGEQSLWDCTVAAWAADVVRAAAAWVDYMADSDGGLIDEEERLLAAMRSALSDG